MTFLEEHITWQSFFMSVVAGWRQGLVPTASPNHVQIPTSARRSTPSASWSCRARQGPGDGAGIPAGRSGEGSRGPPLPVEADRWSAWAFSGMSTGFPAALRCHNRCFPHSGFGRTQCQTSSSPSRSPRPSPMKSVPRLPGACRHRPARRRRQRSVHRPLPQGSHRRHGRHPAAQLWKAG